MGMDKPWLRHYPKGVPPTLSYPDVPLFHYLLDAAERAPNRPAIGFFGKNLTYAEVADRAKRLARALQALGVQKGDRVAIMLPNCPASVIGYYGALLAGAVVVQTNPLYTERELEHQLADSGAETILVLDQLFPRVWNVRGKTSLRRIITVSLKDDLPFPKNVLYPWLQRRKGQWVRIPKDADGVWRLMDLLRAYPPEPEPVAIDPRDDLALFQYTGGTTGTPKAAMLTHRNLVANTEQCVAWMGNVAYGQEVILGVLPFFHVYGMTVVMNFAVRTAAKMVLVPKFDVNEVLKRIEKERPTLFPGAPTIYVALINHPDIRRYDLSSIKVCLSGSAPLPVDVQQKFEALTGGRLVEGYGLSETSPVTHANPIDGRNVAGSIGVPWPDTDCRIVDPQTGQPLPPRQIGEVAVRGPQVMKGYWNQPEQTAAVLRDGWLLTGDLGYMDEDGYFYIVDRKKDMIIAGGYNIYPREVEEVLYEHPAVREAAVIGVPDPYRGETVKAFIVLKDGAHVTEQELDAFCRQRLAAYKVPRIYEFRQELPKSAVGKVLRRVLQEEERGKREEVAAATSKES